MCRLRHVVLAGLAGLVLAAPARAQVQLHDATAPAAQAATAPEPAFSPTLSIDGLLHAELDAGGTGDSRFPAANRVFLRRARLGVRGAILPSVTYRVQVDLGGSLGSSTGATASLSDGYLEWASPAGPRVRIGQFKAPFGREWLVSSSQLVTAERSLASDRLTLNRQIGAALVGDWLDGRVNYQVGAFNGNGKNTTVNDNDSFLYVARGTVQPWQTPRGVVVELGANAYRSRDTALSMSRDFALDSTPDSPAPDNLFTGRRTGVGVDGRVTAGAWRLDAEFLHVRFDQDGAGDVRDVAAAGWYIQPAVFVYGRTLQVAGRFEQFRPNTSTSALDTTTWVAGLTWYAHGTSAKVVANYLWVDTPSPDDEHSKLLAQLQVQF